eukprot:m.95189 g.95189  ORF g.95189 m.95189 type:complete len:677 (-) comp13483_c0_seq2:55-2085(-)
MGGCKSKQIMEEGPKDEGGDNKEDHVIVTLDDFLDKTRKFNDLIRNLESTTRDIERACEHMLVVYTEEDATKYAEEFIEFDSLWHVHLLNIMNELSCLRDWSNDTESLSVEYTDLSIRRSIVTSCFESTEEMANQHDHFISLQVKKKKDVFFRQFKIVDPTLDEEMMLDMMKTKLRKYTNVVDGSPENDLASLEKFDTSDIFAGKRLDEAEQMLNAITQRSDIPADDPQYSKWIERKNLKLKRREKYPEWKTLFKENSMKQVERGDISSSDTLLELLTTKWDEIYKDGANVYNGVQPKSWGKVACTLATMLHCAATFSFESVNTVLKPKILRLLAHSHTYVEGKYEDCDMDVTCWFSIITKACEEELNKLPQTLHDFATENNCLRPLSYKLKYNSDTIVQTLPYLQELNKTAQKRERGGWAKGNRKKADDSKLRDAQLSAMAIHSYYIDNVCIADSFNELATEFGEVKRPPTKELNRMEIKMNSDYRNETVPMACILDTVRRSLTCESIQQQEAFLEKLDSISKKKMENATWSLVRGKSTMSDPGASVKQTIANFIFSPMKHKNELMGLKVSQTPITFKDMTSDEKFQEIANECKIKNGIPQEAFLQALELLRHEAISEDSIQIVVEIQLYLNAFLEKRRMCHIWYKVVRAANAQSLTKDCAKFATEDTMSYQRTK